MSRVGPDLKCDCASFGNWEELGPLAEQNLESFHPQLSHCQKKMPARLPRNPCRHSKPSRACPGRSRDARECPVLVGGAGSLPGGAHSPQIYLRSSGIPGSACESTQSFQDVPGQCRAYPDVVEHTLSGDAGEKPAHERVLPGSTGYPRERGVHLSVSWKTQAGMSSEHDRDTRACPIN